MSLSCLGVIICHLYCVQAHSAQMLMPAAHFSLGAATAGLLPDERLLTYPKVITTQYHSLSLIITHYLLTYPKVLP